MELVRLAESEGPSWLHSQKRGNPNPQKVGSQLDMPVGENDQTTKKVEVQAMQFRWERANGFISGISL